MAGVTTRGPRRPYGDIVPQFFYVTISRPSDNGWQDPEVELKYEPVQMVESDSGEISILKLRLELGRDPEFGLIAEQENIGNVRWIQSGSRIVLKNNNDDTEWFTGFVGQDETLVQGSPQAEGYSLTVYGPEWLLDGEIVEGMWFAKNETDIKILIGTDTDEDRTSANVEFTDLPAIFNEGGKPNMSEEAWIPDEADASEGYAVFVPPDRKTSETTAQLWTAFKAIRAIDWLLDRDAIISQVETNWVAIKKVLGDTVIGEVDVDGLSLLASYRAILGPIGFGFKLSVVSDGKDSFEFSVYSLRGEGSGSTPNLPVIGSGATAIEGARGEVSRLVMLRDAHLIANEINVRGSRKLYSIEHKFTGQTGRIDDLYPAWEDAQASVTEFIEDGAFKIASLQTNSKIKDRYNRSGKLWSTYKNWFRLFVYNEDGALDISEYGEDGIPTKDNLGDLGEALTPRPYKNRNLRDTDGRRFDPQITMSVVHDGQTFTVDATKDFDILPDRAGILLKTDLYKIPATGIPTSWTPWADSLNIDGEKSEAMASLNYMEALYNALTSQGDDKLTITVTATMASTEVVQGTAKRKTSSPLHLTRKRLIRNESLQWRDGVDSIDDSNTAKALADTIQLADDAEIGHTSILLQKVTRSYPPGTKVTGTSGRVIDLQLNSQRDSGAVPVVRKVIHTFGETNTTELDLDSPLMRLT